MSRPDYPAVNVVVRARRDVNEVASDLFRKLTMTRSVYNVDAAAIQPPVAAAAPNQSTRNLFMMAAQSSPLDITLSKSEHGAGKVASTEGEAEPIKADYVNAMAAGNALNTIAFARPKVIARLKVVSAFKPYRSAPSAPEVLSKTLIAASIADADVSDSKAAYSEAYEKAGFSPIVLRPNDKQPAFKGWQTMPATTVFEILRANTAYNLGIAIPEGYFSVDIDVKNGAKGLETLQAWEAKYGPLEGMLIQHTASGGLHFLFKLPPGVRLKNFVGVAPGIDIRGPGGYIVVEPSVVNGNGYYWSDYVVLSEPMPDIPLAPNWLINLCPKHQNTEQVEQIEGGDTTIYEGQRNDTLFHKACALRGQGLNEEEIRIALLGINARQCRPPLPESEVAAIAKSAMTYLPNPISLPLNRMQRRDFTLKLRTAARLFMGKPKAMKWLIDFVFPLGKVIVVASPPGIGKSFSALELAIQITSPNAPSPLDNATPCFGGRVGQRGKVVFISAEDDEEEMHRRLYALLGDRPMPEHLHIVSLPDQGHFSVVQGDPRHGMTPTPAWVALKEEILGLDNVVLIVVDTFQAVSAGDLNAAEIAQAMMNELVEVANQTGASVMVLHHLIKWAESLQKHGVPSAHAAMDAIRGSGAIAGSVRAAYVLMPHPDAKKICEEMGERYEENKVVFGILAKANGPARRDSSIYVRDKHGVLRDRTLEYRDGTKGSATLLTGELVDAITKAYNEGMPFAVSKASSGSLHRRRFELPKQFHNLRSDWFVEHAENLVREGRIQKALVKNGFQYVPVVPIGFVPDASPVADENNALAVKLKKMRVVKTKRVSKRRKPD